MSSELSKSLINLPKHCRDWCIANIAPETFARWSRQAGNLRVKIELHMNGEPLSGLAIYERSEQP